MPLTVSAPALMTAPFTLSATGLTPGRPVTLHARTTDRHGEPWTSNATFVPDAGGVVDVAAHTPGEGTYGGIDPWGLLWSMRPRADLSPAFFETPAEGYALTVQLRKDGTVLDEVRTIRLARAPGLREVVVTDSGVQGVLFTPSPGQPVRGAAVHLGGSEGGLYPAVGALLASEGYVVLSLAYFGRPNLPASLVNVPLEYFHRGLRFLRSTPGVAGRRVGVVGASKGAEAALLLGATYPADVGAVVAVAPSGMVYQGIDREGTFPAGQPMSSWSLGGEPLPYLPYRVDWAALFAGPRPVRLTPVHVEALHTADPATRDAATIPAERIRGPVLLVSGGDDQVWNAHELSIVAQRRREAAGQPVEHLSDPEAGHALSLPGVPTHVSTPWSAMGGTAEADARLQRLGWQRTLDVLDSVWR